MKQQVESLYIHVPFCAKKCSYCAFYSEPSSGDIIQRYVGAILRELEMEVESLAPKNVFFGGGTPSLLNLAQWRQIFDTFDRLGLSGAEEWTVECNPATVSRDKAMLFRERGVNRISMGVQSLDESLLDRLGRVHSREMVFRSFDILREAGFDNVNLDLMFAIPGQTMAIWKSTLTEALALQSEHLSSYEVIYEEDTPLFEQMKMKQFEIDEDLAADMYEELVNRAASAGLEPYEISNFARTRGSGEIPDRACRHNVNYWRGGSFYGLGPSASGYLDGIRTLNVSDTIRYCERLEKGERAWESVEELGGLARAGEIAGFGLRMNSGWDFLAFKKLTGFDFATVWSQEMRQLSDLGYAEMTENRFRLTRAGLRYADWAAELFLRPTATPSEALLLLR